jgi:hypothetical protein
MTARTYGAAVQTVRRITDADVPSVVSFGVEASPRPTVGMHDHKCR